jgi:hypothetical protein
VRLGHRPGPPCSVGRRTSGDVFVAGDLVAHGRLQPSTRTDPGRFPAGWNKVQLSRWTSSGNTVIADAIQVR